MGREGDQVDRPAKRRKVELACTLHCVAMNQRPVGVGELRHLIDRLNDAGFVVGEHDRDGCGLCGAARQQRLESLEPDAALGIDWNARRFRRSRQHGIMFDHAGQNARARDPADRLVVRLCPARRKGDPVNRHAEPFGKRRPGPVNQGPLGTAVRMDRRRIAAFGQGRRDRRNGFGARRRGRIVIEVDEALVREWHQGLGWAA